MRAAAMTTRARRLTHDRSAGGFTLIELVMVIALLGIMAGVAIPVIGSFINSSKIGATKEEMLRLAKAISGSEEAYDRGFEGDVGYAPSSLTDLAIKPDSISAWDAFLDMGWNGPYIEDTDDAYLTDAWGQDYGYDPSARTITSVGGGDTITIGF